MPQLEAVQGSVAVEAGELIANARQSCGVFP